MCGPHWFSLPKSLQQDVYRTWRRYCAANPDTPAAWIGAHEQYVTARQRAIEYVAGGTVAGQT